MKIRELITPIDQLKVAASLVVRTRVFLDAWWLSAGEPGRSENFEFWEDNWNYWRFNEHALLFSFIVHVAGLFEKRKDTICFHALNRSLNLPEDDLQSSSLQSLFDEAEPITKSVMILRSNAMAHRSANLSYNDAFKRANTTPYQLRRLSDISLLIVNELLRLSGLDPAEFCDSAIDDLKSMIDGH